MDFLIPGLGLIAFIVIYFFFETILEFGGTPRIVVGSLVAGLGICADPRFFWVRWLFCVLGLVIALRGVAYLTLRLLQTHPVLPLEQEIKTNDR